MSETYEIRKVKNGFCIFEGSTFGRDPGMMIRDTPYVFETLDNALKFLKDRYTEKKNDTEMVDH